MPTMNLFPNVQDASWLVLTLASAFLLSCYDLAKKRGVTNNSVFPVLFISTTSGAALLCAFLAIRGELGAALSIPLPQALAILGKALILLVSWTSTYTALKVLPISTVAPIRSTSPLWTFLGALLIYQERPTPLQLAGIALTLVGCWLFSLAGKAEGLAVFRNRFTALAFLGAFSGAASAIMDKCLLQKFSLPSETVLLWYMGGLAVIYGAICIVRREFNLAKTRFEWRWSIPLIGILLVLADDTFFRALSAPGTPISILAVVRRSSVVFTFVFGGALFHETNLRRKGIALLCILAGVVMLCLK